MFNLACKVESRHLELCMSTYTTLSKIAYLSSLNEHSFAISSLPMDVKTQIIQMLRESRMLKPRFCIEYPIEEGYVLPDELFIQHIRCVYAINPTLSPTMVYTYLYTALTLPYIARECLLACLSDPLWRI